MSIIEFPKDDPAYWACDCGCMTHHVRSDGQIECANCEALMDKGYYKPMPDGIVRDTIDSDPEPYTLTFSDSHEFAMRRFADRLKSGEFCAAIGLRENGRTATVGQVCETAERRVWLRRRLRDAYRLLTRNSHDQ